MNQAGSSRSADVAIVGAGPAGTAAAINLARAGRSVVVVDKARFPRDKCCGDGLTSAALRHLDHLGLDPSAVASWEPLGGVRIRIPAGTEQRFAFPDGPGTYAAVARRSDLDAALVDLARAAGAEVVEGVAVTGAEVAPGGPVRLTLGDGSTLASWYALGADGMWSPLRKLLSAGAAGYLGDWHAVRQYFSHTGPEAREMWVWFEEDLLPGYAWSFPLPGGGANVGFGIHRHADVPTGSMKAVWADLLDRPHVARVLGPDATPDGPWKAWPIPARIGSSPLSAAGGRVIFVGDAARAGDTMTGEGIAQALETAQLASTAILTAGAGAPSVAARRYRATVTGGLLADDLLGRAFTRLMSHTRGANGWLPVAMKTEWGRRQFAPWMFEHFPRALPATPYRWRRGILERPGAFAGTAGPHPAA
ncbi:FAD-dependent monooxygenase [Acidiferrimicrobium sp. IK]|uniref:NAD(P)/FAD-dependent oxidoreductase n=1 Tax=Acidiferrimicrobium sp. IK TaxID=2871700 RepID=UPI0021CB2525|nr:FAD-dependent oxidoreductase [Acidiferrimicrobium sp. IK]MCU4183817.1 FAD-dependent monooxygenase [Acidiferrimicrobium sp. IK]